MIGGVLCLLCSLFSKRPPHRHRRHDWNKDKSFVLILLLVNGKRVFVVGGVQQGELPDESSPVHFPIHGVVQVGAEITLQATVR